MKKNIFFQVFNYIFIFLFLSLLVYTFYRAEIVHNSNQLDYYLKYYVIFSLALIFWIFVLILNLEFKIFFINSGILILLLLYVFEIVKFYNISFMSLFSEKKIETPLKSEKMILVEQLDKKNKNTFPSIIPNIFLNKGDINLFPLGGVSNATTVFCKEGPKFSVYKSDRFGFNNPDNNWNSEIENLFIGDSFAQGACVKEGEDIASQIRLSTKSKTLTLGMAGNGPLIELASLKEYSKNIKVKNIFWVYFERNDLNDLKKEKKNKILIKYLDRNFSQNLKEKQSIIDNILKQNIIKEKKNFLSKNSIGDKKNKDVFQKIIRLKILRDKLALDRGLNLPVDSLFKEIILNAKNYANKKGSNFYFVYLPDKETFKKHNLSKKNLFKKDQILKILEKNKINLIDIQSLVFTKEEDPISLFAHRTYGHYSAETYSKIAAVIVDSIK